MRRKTEPKFLSDSGLQTWKKLPGLKNTVSLEIWCLYYGWNSRSLYQKSCFWKNFLRQFLSNFGNLSFVCRW
jgi:magnesium-transporting ATPase (P-type)